MSAVQPATWDWTAAWHVCLVEAARVVGHGHEAEEAAQEALVRAWRRRASCRSAAARPAWLATIARNEALRLAGRRTRLVLYPEAPEVPEDDREIDQVIDSVGLAQALGWLTEEERKLLKLRYEEDLTQPQVADALGVPEGTVKVRLHRLRRRLRDGLEGCGYGER